MKKVCVLGSINMDLVINVDKLPKEGETLLAQDFNKIPGGKGANQAIAAKRLGTKVYMIGQIGNDDNGRVLLNDLINDGIYTEYIYKSELAPTGIAVITVDKKGNNIITVVSGANMDLNAEQIKNAEKVIKNSDIIISQFEVPTDSIIQAFEIAKENNKITILNPAPARDIPEKLLKLTDIIVPNETEVYELTGIKVTDLQTASEAAQKFLSKEVKFVIITMGENGAALVSNDNKEIFEAYKVNAVDTTAAGDSFIGGIATIISNYNRLDYKVVSEAVKFGNKVSSIAVTKKGAQSSIPTFEEVLKKYKEE